MKRSLSLVTFAVLLCCASGPTFAQSPAQERMKSCAQQWDAMKAANRTGGQSYRDFQKGCLSRQGSSSTTASAPATKTTPPRSAKRESVPSTVGSGGPTSTMPPQSVDRWRANTSGQRSTAQSARNCGSDQVVWANPSTKVYHFSGSRFFGHTKEGTYMCLSESEREGYRAAKNEKASSTR